MTKIKVDIYDTSEQCNPLAALYIVSLKEGKKEIFRFETPSADKTCEDVVREILTAFYIQMKM